MKAVICTKYGSPEVLQITEVDKPVATENEVLIRIYATTVTVADIRIRSFTVPLSFWIPARLMLGITKPKRPILGVELAGEIEAIGSKVRRFKLGDKVFAATLPDMGTYATHKCLPEDGMIASMPTNSTYQEAAAIPVGALTALHFLKKGEITSGQKVLIYGASGSVGTYAVQLAKHLGAEVTGVCSTSNLAWVKALGADKMIDYTEPNFAQKLETYDVIFLAVDKLPFPICKRALRLNGIYLNVTAPVKNLEMIWTTLTTSNKLIMAHSPSKNVENLIFLKNLVESGAIRPIIDREFSLDEIVEAHRYVEKGHKKGNVVVTI